MSDSIPKFIGTIIQRFNIRNGKAAKPYRDNIEEIKEVITTDFVKTMHQSNMMFEDGLYGVEFVNADYCLAEIPDFQGLLPKSYDAGVPVFELTDSDIRESGSVLDQMKGKRDKFKKIFEGIADTVMRIAG